MKLYRATGVQDYSGTGSCWTPRREDAEAYWDNPGFGGPHLLCWEGEPESGSVLDLTRDHDEFGTLFEAAGLDQAEWLAAGRKFPDYIYQVWEWWPDVAEALQARGYAWIVYEDDYPARCETWAYIGRPYLHATVIATRPCWAEMARRRIEREDWSYAEALAFGPDWWQHYDEEATLAADPDDEQHLFCFDDASILRWTGTEWIVLP